MLSWLHNRRVKREEECERRMTARFAWTTDWLSDAGGWVYALRDSRIDEIYGRRASYLAWRSRLGIAAFNPGTPSHLDEAKVVLARLAELADRIDSAARQAHVGLRRLEDLLKQAEKLEAELDEIRHRVGLPGLEKSA